MKYEFYNPEHNEHYEKERLGDGVIMWCKEDKMVAVKMVVNGIQYGDYRTSEGRKSDRRWGKKKLKYLNECVKV